MISLLPYLPTRLLRLVHDRRGVTAMEYGIIAAVTVAVIGAVMVTIQGNLSTIWNDISTALTNSSGAA